MKTLILLALAIGALALSAHAAAPTSLRFQDSFPAHAPVEAHWDLAGEWALAKGALRTPGAGRNTAYAFAAPELAQQTITVRMSVGPRGTAGGWAYAGILLAQDPANYWHLALVEAPDGHRYGELVEQLNGVWQAQTSAATRLAPDPEGARQPWEPGTFVFVLRLSDRRLEGEILGEDGRAVFEGGYRFAAGVPAVRSGRVGLEGVEMAAAAREVRMTSGTGVSPVMTHAHATSRAAVLSAALPGMPRQLPAKIASALKRAGLHADLLSPDQVADPARFSRARYSVIVAPQCQTFPGVARENLLAFLREGGNLIALGGPIFENVIWQRSGKWVGDAEMLAALQPAHTAIDWSRQDLAAWKRGSSHPDVKTTHRVIAGGEGGPSHALQMDIPRIYGWDTFISPPMPSAFARGDTVTVFSAKSSVDTTTVIEWTERDGSRWIAPIQLTRKWKRCVLPLEAFRYWPDNPSKGRGAKGDHLNVENVDHLSVGVAIGFGFVPGESLTVWFGDIGTAPPPPGLTAWEPPLLEAMSPWYKVYRTQAARAKSDPTSPFPTGAHLDQPFEAVCPIWRSRGLGCTGMRPGRWVPLLYAYDKESHLRGAVASTYTSLSGPFRNATWTSIGIPDSSYVLRHLDAIGPLIADAAKRVSAGFWLTKAGADRFGYFTDEPVSVAAYVSNFTDRPSPVACEFLVRSAQTRAVLLSGEALASPDARSTARVAAPWPATPLPPGLYCVTVTLAQGGKPIDRIEHEFRVIEPPRGPAQDIVSAHDGDFWLNGQKWYPHGINYWPSYATGLEPFEYWLHWLSPQQYDPEVVERDLAALQMLGANVVSIQYNTRDQAPALNRFLQQARGKGILVNIFIPGAHPLNINEAQFTDLVNQARLRGNPAVFSYDIAWEPALGEEAGRRRFEPEWTAWVKDRYGSIENAARDWSFESARRDDGSLAGPTQAQVLNDGDHRRMVAAYRRFVDDMISAGYNRVTRVLRALDPTHLIGSRTGYGGAGQPGVDAAMPFDLRAGAKHLDFVSPEGYGLSGAWENFEAGGFTSAYARWAGNDKPVFWAEFGMPIYPNTTPEKYVEQGELYRNIYRMIVQSGANGSAGWWFPGGLRIDENSDFGIINPDGTPRPSALALKEFASRIEAARERKAPEVWITIDRDLHPRGYSQVWARGRQAYLDAIRAGKSVGLRTEGTGATSADCPPVAVGDVPWNGPSGPREEGLQGPSSRGGNPPKYLNAEFNSVAVRGDQVTASIGNTGEATWLSPASAAGRPGAVYLLALVGEREVARAPIGADLPRFGDATVTLTLPPATRPVQLVMAAQGRTRFGPRWSLEP